MKTILFFQVSDSTLLSSSTINMPVQVTSNSKKSNCVGVSTSTMYHPAQTASLEGSYKLEGFEKTQLDEVLDMCADYERHKLFGNNFDLHAFPRHGRVFSTVEKYKLRQDQSVFDVIFYLAATLFKTSSFILHLLYGVGILFRKSFDFLVDYAIRNKLSTVLCCNRIAYLIRLVESSLFDTSASEPEDKARRKELAMEHFMKFLRPLIQPLTGRNNYEDGIHFVFEALQDPVLNKQLSWVLIDTALTELFPEISVSKMRA